MVLLGPPDAVPQHYNITLHVFFQALMTKKRCSKPIIFYPTYPILCYIWEPKSGETT